jgi:hypothetical protein
MRIVFIVVFLIFAPVFMAAEVESSTDLGLQISTRPEAKLSLSQGFTFPFLRGGSALTMGNNINTVFIAEFTPISMNGIAEVNFTPAAFFVLSGGGLAGSGWNMPLGYGIGINRPKEGSLPREAEIDGSAFDGLMWKAWGAGTLQFDLAALVPGDWNHVLFQSRQEFRYSAYTRAGPDDAWVFESDDAENKNGLVYRASYVLGYSMPQSPVLDTVAFMAELDKSLYNTPGGDFWGENLGKWVFSGLFNFSVNPRFNAALALQMYTRRNYGTGNFETDRDHYYQDFELKTEEGGRRVLFYRAALIMNYRLR